MAFLGRKERIARMKERERSVRDKLQAVVAMKNGHGGNTRTKAFQRRISVTVQTVL